MIIDWIRMAAVAKDRIMRILEEGDTAFDFLSASKLWSLSIQNNFNYKIILITIQPQLQNNLNHRIWSIFHYGFILLKYELPLDEHLQFQFVLRFCDLDVLLSLFLITQLETLFKLKKLLFTKQNEVFEELQVF